MYWPINYCFNRSVQFALMFWPLPGTKDCLSCSTNCLARVVAGTVQKTELSCLHVDSWFRIVGLVFSVDCYIVGFSIRAGSGTGLKVRIQVMGRAEISTG
jgi:hypothetical protein